MHHPSRILATTNATCRPQKNRWPHRFFLPILISPQPAAGTPNRRCFWDPPGPVPAPRIPSPGRPRRVAPHLSLRSSYRRARAGRRLSAHHHTTTAQTHRVARPRPAWKRPGDGWLGCVYLCMRIHRRASSPHIPFTNSVRSCLRSAARTSTCRRGVKGSRGTNGGEPRPSGFILRLAGD
jgi:hypothetical protein